jgi:hypothetical protein
MCIVQGLKLKHERNSAQCACLLLSNWLVVKYTIFLWSVKTSITYREHSVNACPPLNAWIIAISFVS